MVERVVECVGGITVTPDAGMEIVAASHILMRLRTTDGEPRPWDGSHTADLIKYLTSSNMRLRRSFSISA